MMYGGMYGGYGSYGLFGGFGMIFSILIIMAIIWAVSSGFGRNRCGSDRHENDRYDYDQRISKIERSQEENREKLDEILQKLN
ncbi:MAG: putative rane protein [Methanolobus sp.]|nr:putative rane protein [Methanolobus sp.]MDK2947479.1 putative rane protein [Methanolobus sp.]